jgi:phosphate transport system substrate-binding protein
MAIDRLFPTIALLAAALIGAALAAEPVVVGGTGSSGPLMQLLIDRFRSSHPQAEFRIVTPPMGSGGALRALAAGKIDIAVTARRPDEDGAGIRVAVELARTPFVMATRDGVRPRGFGLAELAEVYAGRLTAWDDGRPIRLILRAPEESDTLALRAMSPEMDAAVRAAAQRTGMVTAENDLDTLEVLEKVPAALAPTTLGLLHTLGKDHRVLPLAGVAPTLVALESGRYPWSKRLFAVHDARPTPATRAFLDFLRTAAAQETMRRADYLPAPTAR